LLLAIGGVDGGDDIAVLDVDDYAYRLRQLRQRGAELAYQGG
jgi:hypothetical protein